MLEYKDISPFVLLVIKWSEGLKYLFRCQIDWFQGCLDAIQNYVKEKSIIFMAIGGGTLAVQVRQPPDL